jgi:hypothetical protein
MVLRAKYGVKTAGNFVERRVTNYSGDSADFCVIGSRSRPTLHLLLNIKSCLCTFFL